MDAVDRPPPHPPYTLLGLLLWGQTDALSPSGSSARGFAAGIDASLFLSIYLERGAVALQWLGLVLVTVFLLRRLSDFLRLWVASRSIPGPPWGSFFLDKTGCSKGEDVNDYLSKMHERYGSIVKIWLSPSELLVSVKDPLAIREVLIKVKDKFPLFGRALRLAFGKCSLFAPSYEEVKRRKEFLEFNLNKNLIGKSNTLSFEVLKWVLERDHLVIFENFFDCYSISQQFAFYFLGTTLFGSSFFLWQNAAIFEELLLSVAEDANLLNYSKIPPIWKVRFWRHCWLYLKLRCLSLKLIQQCTSNGNLSEQICQYDTGKSVMFGLKDTATEESCYEGIYRCLIPEEEACGNVIGVMCHGTVRIAGLIYHLLSRLVLQPELQEQIYMEIKEFQDEDGGSGSDRYDVQKMQLLMATVYESIRLLPAGPLLQRYTVNQDTQQEKAKHDTEFFLMGGENETAAFFPFGLGLRACVGQKLVIHGVSTLLASLLLHYQVKLPPALPGHRKRETSGPKEQQDLPNQKIVLLRRNPRRLFSRDG